MTASGGNTLPASNVTIMVGGTLHVPTLHEKLSPLVGTLTLAMVPSQLNATDHPMLKERLCYVMKARGVQALKVDDQLSNRDVDGVRFIKNELTPWILPG